MLGLLGTNGALSALLAFADDAEPNQEAIALSTTTGWLFLLGALAVFALFFLNSERWRRFWLQAEDPRSIAVYRIVFGFFVICNMNDFWEYFHFLFTDEGIFTADVARQVHASAQFAGFGDGFTEDSPYGFFDTAAVIEFLKGPKYSLLYFWDTPEFFWGHLWTFEVCAALFMLGLWTRVTGVLTLLLMNSIFFRNHLFWEGTELVYRVFLVYLICAKSGHAYSIDNWLRCRSLRKAKLLSEPGKPGDGAGAPPSEDHPSGLQAIYRLIPAWPRRLMMIQLGCVYAFTGMVKNGSVWARGDAIYYAWNLDHFYRFYPQKLSALFGTNALRMVTWTSHWGEALFSVVLLSVLYWWGKSQGFSPAQGLRRIAIRVCLAVLLYVAAALVWVTWPVHFTPNLATAGGRGGMIGVSLAIVAAWWWMFLAPRVKSNAVRYGSLAVIAIATVAVFSTWPIVPRGGAWADVFSRQVFVTVFVAAIATLWMSWSHLADHPIEIRSILWIRPLKKPWLLDRDWLMTWVLGRRIWVTWHFQLMFGIFILMNIGHFQTAMLAQTIIFFSGLEIARFGRWIQRKGKKPIPTEDESLPHHHRDAARFPQWAMWATLAIVLAGVLIKVQYDPEWWHRVWLAALLFATGVAFQRRRAARRTKTDDEARPDRDTLAKAASAGTRMYLFGAISLLALFTEFALLWWSRDPLSFLLQAPVAAACIWAMMRAYDAAARRFELAGPALAVSKFQSLSVEDPQTERARTPWAYGPTGRFLIGGLLIWHITAVTVWVSPDKNSLENWRPKARKIFAKYLTVTQTDQGWGMFAPNPPRSNVFLKVLVTDANGEVFDMKTDVYAPERKPIPWIWNDRMRKMNRRIIGGESGNTQWYRKWYARWHCRDWQLTHGGEFPEKVELVKVWYKIPSPEEVAEKGWYQPEELYERTKTEKVEHTERCRNTYMGQLPDWLRERHGLPPLPEDAPYKPWLKHKKRKWDKRNEPPETEEERKARQEREREEKRAKAAERRKAAAERARARRPAQP